jgi:uncharacterized protein (DUF2235 family)
MPPSGSAVIEQASLNQAQAQGFPASPPSACQTCPHQLVLGAFFDGTGNNMYRDFAGSVGEGSETNVARLYRLYRAHNDANRAREKLYVVGVGAMTNPAGTGLSNQLPTDQRARALRLRDLEMGSSLPFAGDVVGKATGLGGMERLKIAYRWAEAWCRSVPGSEPKLIDVYGFSRGAAMARTFVNLVLVGLKKDFENVSVRFLGVFDTVGSFGKGGDDVDVGQNMGISPGDATHVRHYTARHEQRKNFPLTALRGDREYAGAHSDVGGGYAKIYEGATNHLAFVPLFDMHHSCVTDGEVEMSALELPAGVDVEKLRADSEKYWPGALDHVRPGGEFAKARERSTRIISTPRTARGASGWARSPAVAAASSPTPPRRRSRASRPSTSGSRISAAGVGVGMA